LIIRIKYILQLVFVVLFFASCKNTIPADKNQYMLWKNDFKGNKKILDEELLQIIPFSQRENSKPLGLPITPRVWWYNFGLQQFDSTKHQKQIEVLTQKIDFLKSTPSVAIRKLQKTEKKLEREKENLITGNAWFWRNIGEKRVYITIEKIDETSLKIKKYLFDIGYRDATVVYQLDSITRAKRLNIAYIINENTPFRIDSVQYDVSDPIIDSILQANLSGQIVQNGNLFDLRLVEAEKIRVEQLLKNNGFYYFNNKYILHGASNFNNDEQEFKDKKGGNLKFEILNPDNKLKHEQYYINEVIFKAFDPNSTKNIQKPDTLIYKNVKFIRLDKGIPLGVISERILSKPLSIYKIKDVVETQRQIGMFNQFAFASSQIKTLAPNQLSVEYFAPLLEKYTFGISPGINNIYNDGSTFFGFGVPVSLTARNRFKKLETVEASFRASYEGQPSPIVSTDNNIRGSLELGVNLNVTLPNIWFFNQNMSKINLKNPRTILSLGYNYSEPFWGKRLNFKLRSNYSIQFNKNAFLYLSLLDANLTNTTYFNNAAGRSFYNSLIEQQKLGNNLKVTFDPQFVSSLNLNYVFNNQNPSKAFLNYRFFRIFAESGGTVLNFLKDKEKINIVEKLFPLKPTGIDNSKDSTRAYFRFIKVNIDYRRNINISAKSSYAYRVNVGITNPYGANRSLPYEKNFFIGGSNSVRAWAPRTLGTGSSKADTTSGGNTIPQPGDILFETSVEYRKKVFRLAGDIQIAGFIDAGNVWKWHQINTPDKKDKSNFEFNRFLKEIAVGTGVGIRWDLSYFLFRFDWGIKVVDPARKVGTRFVLDEFSLRKNKPYGVNWNFGIGYPF
jgi:outer membrane protein insertion porin family